MSERKMQDWRPADWVSAWLCFSSSCETLDKWLSLGGSQKGHPKVAGPHRQLWRSNEMSWVLQTLKHCTATWRGPVPGIFILWVSEVGRGTRKQTVSYHKNIHCSRTVLEKLVPTPSSLQLIEALLTARRGRSALPDGLMPTISDHICKCNANGWQDKIAKNLAINEEFHEINESDVGDGSSPSVKPLTKWVQTEVASYQIKREKSKVSDFFFPKNKQTENSIWIAEGFKGKLFLKTQVLCENYSVLDCATKVKCEEFRTM